MKKHQKWLVTLAAATLPIWTGPSYGENENGLSFGDLSVAHAQSNDEGSVKIDLMTVDELKSMLAKNQPVTVIDVRSTESFAESDNQIKGSIHFKLRRLKSRFRFPPLRDLSRDSEIVTYCSCPDDKASIRAAQILIGGGFKRVRALKGGWTAWVNARGPVQPRLK